MTSKSNETKNPERGEEQHQHHKNPSEGSPKQVPPPGVLLRFLTSQIAYEVYKLAKRLTKNTILILVQIEKHVI